MGIILRCSLLTPSKVMLSHALFLSLFLFLAVCGAVCFPWFVTNSVFLVGLSFPFFLTVTLSVFL